MTSPPNQKTKLYFLFGFLISLLYFSSRFWHLTAIPVFGDEAIYLRWSQVIRSVETLRFLPLTDGKQPLFMWLTIPFLKILSDPLIAGRTLSILAGFGTLTGIALIVYFFTKNIFSSLVSALIYILLPFSFFFDRLALPDNLLSMFGVWSLYLSLLLGASPRFDLSMLLGVVLGAAWLTKSPAVYFLVLAPLTFFAINPKNIKKIYFPVFSLVIGFFIYNILRLGPQFHQIALRNRDYVWPLSEILRHPFDPLKPHLSDIITIYRQYLGLIILFSLVSVKHFFTKAKYLLPFFWFFCPLIATAAFAKVFTARYILFTLPPLIVLIALGYHHLQFKYKQLLLLLVLAVNLPFLTRLYLSPQTLTLPSTETGYLRDWTSGWGIKVAADYLKNRAEYVNVIVGTEGNFGTLPDGLQIYANNVPHLTVIGLGLGFKEIPSSLVNAKDYGDEVYLLINNSRIQLSSLELQKLTPIGEYPKPADDKLILFRL